MKENSKGKFRFNPSSCGSHSTPFPSSAELGSPRNLETRDVTDTSFFATWVPAPGKVRQYRITWNSLFDEEAGEKTIGGDTTGTVLDGLTPETRYRVSVYAVYGRGEGQPLVGEETTDSELASLPAPLLGRRHCQNRRYIVERSAKKKIRYIASNR